MFWRVPRERRGWPSPLHLSHCQSFRLGREEVEITIHGRKLVSLKLGHCVLCSIKAHSIVHFVSYAHEYIILVSLLHPIKFNFTRLISPFCFFSSSHVAKRLLEPFISAGQSLMLKNLFVIHSKIFQRCLLQLHMRSDSETLAPSDKPLHGFTSWRCSTSYLVVSNF